MNVSVPIEADIGKRGSSTAFEYKVRQSTLILKTGQTEINVIILFQVRQLSR